MAIKQSIHTLSSSQSILISPKGVHAGVDITIQNLSSTGFIFIGNTETTLTNFGYRISPGSAWSVELSGKDYIYATTDADGTVAAVFMLNLESGN